MTTLIIFLLILCIAWAYTEWKAARLRLEVARAEARKAELQRTLRRNGEVAALRMALIRAALCAPGGHEERMAIIESVTYETMLNSDKPVVARSFYTEEQMQALMDSLQGELAVAEAKALINKAGE